MALKDKEKRKEYNKKYYQLRKCEHNRLKSRCKECGGCSICVHNRIRIQCKDCGGSQICEHSRRKTECKECGGSSICVHNRRKTQCKECGGSQICDHNRQKITCKECGGSQICIHNRIKSNCQDCEGGSICNHSRIKSRCKDCNPVLYMIHLQRNNMQRIMKQTNIEKTKPSIEYLGCSAEYFREYIKSKMTEEMNFDNIHYDHIKPVSAFDLEFEEELLNCCHYTNFQPLLATDNLVKNGKWSEEDDLFWKKNICGKEYLHLYIPR